MSKMAAKNVGFRVNDLFQEEKWEEARSLLEKEREKDPSNHWILTQLGVTFYEQGLYEEALQLFRASLEILDDCPFTLWNLAGVLDALGNYAAAIKVYIWLIESKRTAKNDPCWESEQWTNSLKTDCLYRLGICFQHLGKKKQAEHCYRQYLNLMASGIDSLYTAEDVVNRIRSFESSSPRKAKASELKEAFESTLRLPGIERNGASAGKPPKFDKKDFVGKRVASKR
jgi:tetratricopeptide (TPR) repeat protein